MRQRRYPSVSPLFFYGIGFSAPNSVLLEKTEKVVQFDNSREIIIFVNEIQ